MSTTAVIVEVLIIGFFAAIWLFLFLLRLETLDFVSVKNLASQAGTWSIALVFVSAAIFYQIGTVMNTVSYRITERLRRRLFGDQAVPGTDNELVRATVFQKGSQELVADLKLYLSIVRLGRAGIINFLLIAVCLFFSGSKLFPLGSISLLLSFGCILVWLSMYSTYHKRMIYAYKVITEGNTLSIPSGTITVSIVPKP